MYQGERPVEPEQLGAVGPARGHDTVAVHEPRLNVYLIVGAVEDHGGVAQSSW